MQFSIGSAAEHRSCIPLLADAFEREWPEWCARVGRSHVERLFNGGERDALPLVLIALAGERVAGTIALRPWCGEEAMQETPWVRQLLVVPEWRGRGVDRMLACAVEARAAALGYRWLHAATTRIEPLLVRRGWQVFNRIDHEGEPMVWLRKEIAGAHQAQA